MEEKEKMRPRSKRITASDVQHMKDCLSNLLKKGHQVRRSGCAPNVQGVSSEERPVRKRRLPDTSISGSENLIDYTDGPVDQFHGSKIRSTMSRESRKSHTGRDKWCNQSEQTRDGEKSVCTGQEQSHWDSEVSKGSTTAATQDEASETSAESSALLESEIPSQGAQSSGSWIQFKESSKCPSAQEFGLNESHGNITETVQQTRLDSDFHIIERLGKGAFGFVYKAEHRLLGQDRAIKEIRVKDLDKSLREVKVLSELSHPHILRYYNCWLQDTGYNSRVKSDSKFLFIEMELCDGGTLRHWICKNNRKSSENSCHRQRLEIALQILTGVDYIHTKKLIHRDLKPENILFGQDGNVRIGDFGLATQDDDDEKSGDRGTRNYMAPEQVGINYDRKVDVFALGLIFFELFWRLATGHERAEIWADVRCQSFPEEFTRTYPVECCIIKTMLNQNSEARPEASAVKMTLKKWTRRTERYSDKENLTF